MGAVNAQLPSGASKLSLLDGQQGSNELLTGETQVLRFVAAKTQHAAWGTRCTCISTSPAPAGLQSWRSVSDEKIPRLFFV